MKWFSISGSWRVTNKKLEKDVEQRVKKIILKGNGIVTGGAPGVDFFATKAVLEFGNPKKQLKIFLPIKFNSFCKHMLKRSKEGVIEEKRAVELIKQLKTVYKISKKSIIDKTKFTKANEKSYYARNTSIIEASDELYAFWVNNSLGTLDAINKAKKMKKKVHVRKYKIKRND